MYDKRDNNYRVFYGGELSMYAGQESWAVIAVEREFSVAGDGDDECERKRSFLFSWGQSIG
jgi:hypothetical protein